MGSNKILPKALCYAIPSYKSSRKFCTSYFLRLLVFELPVAVNQMALTNFSAVLFVTAAHSALLGILNCDMLLTFGTCNSTAGNFARK
jgi:hypothetical protein